MYTRREFTGYGVRRVTRVLSKNALGQALKVPHCLMRWDGQRAGSALQLKALVRTVLRIECRIKGSHQRRHPFLWHKKSHIKKVPSISTSVPYWHKKSHDTLVDDGIRTGPGLAKSARAAIPYLS
ncbi:hypothetical protein PISMIDRAFT_23177 [Pisolithus microcarpus 441]|uniref:Uncharacterized protein n=1 Tax=Pisolithus microcarpus 441 TaxID=765257 RepID=A0A0C9ZXM8_9AGAM|nr:hypothetical protein PISMIDRAFT_23177 [Pisolithus microcarpus 441]